MMNDHTPARPRTGALLALLLTAAIARPASASAQWTAPAADTVQQILAQRIERGAAVGLVVAYNDDNAGRIVAAGRIAAPGSPVPDGTTVFEIGSVSKVFTTILLAQMVVAGEVALEDPIAKYLPDSVRTPARSGRQITLLDLATVTSGLPRLPGNLDPADMTNPYADYDADDLYAFLSTYELPRDPGAEYEYSNLGMGLLGHLLSRAAGVPYEQLVIDRILAPLGMSDTRITPTASMRARMATGHTAGLEPARYWDFDVLAGAGAWLSTANDMLRFLTAVRTPPDGPLGAALRMATQPQRPIAEGARIGLGWHILERDGRSIVWHNGATAGFHAFLGFSPQTRGHVVVLANSSTEIDDIALHIVDPAIPLREVPVPRATVAVDTTVLDRYVGRYELAPGFAIEVTRRGNALYAQATNQPEFRLYAASDTLFFLRTLPAEISFTLADAGEVTGLVLHQAGAARPGRKVR